MPPLSTTVVERTARRAVRQQWFDDGCGLTQACDLIFLDADTGLLPTGRRAENADGEEYATIDEVISLCRRGQSVVCVQFGAPGNFEREPVIARQRLAALSAALTAQTLPEPWGPWWRDRHKVGLIVAPSAHHAGTLRARTDEILADAAWSRKVGPLYSWCVAPTGYFAGALGASQGSASPLHDAGSQLLDTCEHIGV